MERNRRIASHQGIVQSTRTGFVSVQIRSVSACASCEAHAHCGFAESKDKTLDIATADWHRFAQGDNVVVHIDQSSGMLAVGISYLLPAILLIAIVAALSAAHLPEGIVALSALATLALYVAALYLLRKHIEKRFSLTIEKNNLQPANP